MKHNEDFFTNHLGQKIYYQSWMPEGDIKAVIFIVHGLGEHGGRYMNVVNHFVPLNYAVYAIDHPGHGKSEGTRVYIDKFEDFISTAEILFDKIRNDNPGKKMVILGHSMGGLIATWFIGKHQDKLTAAVLSGPAVKIPDNTPKAMVAAGKILSKILPKAGVVDLDVEGISRDKRVVEAYNSDPLVNHKKATARLGAELLSAMEKAPEIAATVNIPVIIVQGGADRLVNPDGAKMLYELIPHDDKQLNIFDGYYHEVFNEPEHKEVLGIVEEWLNKHLS